MALLAALCAAVKRNVCRSRLFCLHVEHGLRPAQESCGDADFVRAFCKENEVECHVEHIVPGKVAAYAQRKGIGIEAAARYYRHMALSKQAALLGKNTIILLAHTKDDLLEMALMRVLRGVGPAGLAAMPVKRGRIFRPLLSMSRADVIGYLTERKISWREDSTNTDVKFLRNRIRHQLVPLLNEAFPSWKKGAEAMAQTQSLAADFIAEEARSRIKWTPKIPVSVSAEEENFFAQPLIIREEAVFQAINSFSSPCVPCFPAPLRENIPNKSVKRSVVRKFCSGAVNAADLGPFKVRRKDRKIILSRAQKEHFESGVSVLIDNQP